MLEQSKFLKDKLTSKFVLLAFIALFAIQLFCSACKDNESIVIKSTTEAKSIDTNQNKTISLELKNHLAQDELNNVEKLIGRYKSATGEEREKSKQTLDAADAEFREKRFRVSGEGFMESASVFPTVAALIMAGESVARLDVTDYAKKERRIYESKQMEEAKRFFITAQEFAKKTSQSQELEKYGDLNAKIQCIESVLRNQQSNCEYGKKQ